MKSAIIIPARYGSSRFPGKPLHQIAGKPMLQHVYQIAKTAAEAFTDCQALVATDDERITQVAEKLNIPYVMTKTDCASGSDRVLQAAQQLTEPPEVLINLQGDTPLTPPEYLVQLLQAFHEDKAIDIATLGVALPWADLDEWRRRKTITPHSGTSVVVNGQNEALWFSKEVLPVMRNENELRQQSRVSPVIRHLGIYGYRMNSLQTFVRLPQGRYEQMEGLEQLRLLEHGYDIRVLKVDSENGLESIGVDTIEDANLVEATLAKQGEAV